MTITICVTSDVHGRMDRLQQIKKKIKQLQPDIIIDNGDFLQGSLTSYYYEHIKPQTHPMLALANDIGYDCAVFGNHEFNYPIEHIENMRAACQFPWISANIGNFAKPYFIKQVRGKRVGIVGVTTHFTPLWDEHNFTQSITFTEALQAAHYWVRFVHDVERCDYIILCYHGGFTADVETGTVLAANTGENQANDMLAIPYIDALITGHQHLQITSVVNGVPILQPGANGECIGVITLGSEPCCELLMIDDLGEQYPDDVATWLFEKIGHCQFDLTYDGLLASRIEKPAFVDFLHDVVFTATGADLSVIELMFHENGGIKGDVTRFDVLSNISRPNTLKVLALTGADILAALEQSAAVFAVGPSGNIDFSYNVIRDEPQPYLYDYWGGLSYTIDVSQPVGKRVRDVIINGEALHSETIFRVAMNSYRATGVDFPSFLHKKCVLETADIFPTLILQHIHEHGFSGKSFGEITVRK